MLAYSNKTTGCTNRLHKAINSQHIQCQTARSQRERPKTDFRPFGRRMEKRRPGHGRAPKKACTEGTHAWPTCFVSDSMDTGATRKHTSHVINGNSQVRRCKGGSSRPTAWSLLPEGFCKGYMEDIYLAIFAIDSTQLLGLLHSAVPRAREPHIPHSICPAGETHRR